jgi:hypothetical protein
MKKYIINSIKSIIILCVLTLICTYIYKWNDLDKVFGSKITFSQWMAILVIAQSILPTKELFSSDKNSKDDE